MSYLRHALAFPVGAIVLLFLWLVLVCWPFGGRRPQVDASAAHHAGRVAEPEARASTNVVARTLSTATTDAAVVSGSARAVGQTPAAAGDLHSGCAAALAYLVQHAAPGFVASCPHEAGGHQATTQCVGPPDCVPGTELIWIADPCPAAYMNEASNSYVLIGESDAPWDPFGYCGEPGDPYG